jgi:phosphoribosylamine--glycine ligase
MKILVIGSGGREHAILWSLQITATDQLELFCAPGNAGIAQIAKRVQIKADEIEALAAFAAASGIDLTIVGPEAPLAAGIVDTFEQRGLRIVGPRRAAAQLESSKAFAKDFMRRHRIPTARYRIASSADEAIQILQSGEFGDKDATVVVKADGLAAGKGVIVASSRMHALEAVSHLASGAVDPAAVDRIVIEEALCGREVSLLLFSDGQDFRLMPAARDHKRIGENDTGPNTGGMGSITGNGILDATQREKIVRDIVEPTLYGARAEGFAFRGILFIGLMLTATGPRVLEYNVRFGDPETQAILVRLRSSLVDVFEAIAEQKLGKIQLEWSSGSSACVVLAAAGYPGKPQTGARIEGLDVVPGQNEVAIFHAATERGGQGEWLTAGGRVLGVTSAASNLELALSNCYRVIGNIVWPGMQYRRDIGRS